MKRKVSDSIVYIGVDDFDVDLFEGQYPVKNGMSYNSYVIFDEKITIFDTVDKSKSKQWLNNLSSALEDKKPDYLVVSHMEPDHCASIDDFLAVYPDTTLVVNNKSLQMINNFFPNVEIKNKLVVENGQSLSLGTHKLNFLFAPMVHWPEVMMSYEESEKVLFSADAFGKFGAIDTDEKWEDEARRYYIGIVGKYGKQVQNVLAAARKLDIQTICPLHGPILNSNLGYYLNLYDTWSSYDYQKEGIAVFYTSIYGHTKEAVDYFVSSVRSKGVEVVSYDLARCDMFEAVSAAFCYQKALLATTTYNADIYPFMKTFLDKLTERNFQKRTIGIMENGSWAPMAGKIMKEKLAKCPELTFCENEVTIKSALNQDSKAKIDALVEEMCKSYQKLEVKDDLVDPNALFNIGYGLYVVTSNDGNKDNGLIVNTVTQLTNTPLVIAVTINKLNYSCEVIKKTKKLNVSTLDVSAPFSVFERFGFVSGRDKDKFDGFSHVDRSSNGLLYLNKYANGFISAKVVNEIDLSTHVMFIAEVTQSAILSDKETMTYSYYQDNVKVKPQQAKKGYVCKVCGYVYEGDSLPEDYTCPLCKHPASDFEPLEKSEEKHGYVCKVCGYVYEGDSLPEDYVCPLCKHPASDFEKI